MRDESSLFAEVLPAELLAESVGLPVEEFVELFGMTWRPAPAQPHDYDADPTGLGDIFGPWYVLGEPEQVMARPDAHGPGIEIGRVRGYRAGGEMLQAVDRRSFRPDELADAKACVQEVIRMRRRELRHCQYCLARFGPEGGEGDACWGCQGGWLGMTH